MTHASLPRGLALRLVIPFLVAIGLPAGLAACSAQPEPGALSFTRDALEGDMFRVTARWMGAAPQDLEEQLLTRAAGVARRQGATTFAVVSADLPITNTGYLMEGSPRTPVTQMPPDRPPVQPDAGKPAPYHAQLVIKVYMPGKAPAGARLYDVVKFVHEDESRAASDGSSVRFGVGVFQGTGSGGAGVGIGVTR